MDTVLTQTLPGGVLEIRLNRPEDGNRFDRAMMLSLAEALSETNVAGKTAVLLTHVGDSFCLGGLLGDARTQHAGTVQQFAQGLRTALLAIYRCPVPVLAALEGDTAGGGISLVEACDMAAAANTATFSIPEIHAQMPPVMSYVGMFRALGDKRATAMALLGDTISAREAERCGLITQVVPPGRAIKSCLEWAARLADRNPAAIATIRTLRQRMDRDVYSGQLDAAADLLVGVMMHADTWHALDRQDALKKG